MGEGRDNWCPMCLRWDKGEWINWKGGGGAIGWEGERLGG